MDANTYQREAARTLITDAAVPHFPPEELSWIIGTLELAQHTAALCDALKKGVLHQHGIDRDAVVGRLQQLNARTTRLLDRVDQGRTPSPDLNPFQVRLLWNLAGLIGEGGEVAQTILDVVQWGGMLDRDALVKELGDVLWYVAALCSVAGIPMDEILTTNLAKLQRRYPDGWDAVRSQQRADTEAAAS